MFRHFRFLHHLVTFEEKFGNRSGKLFAIGLPYPNTMHINTHLKYACEISSIVYKSLENNLNQAKLHFPVFEGSRFFMIQFEKNIYAVQEFCNTTIEHKNNIILLSGGKGKPLWIFFWINFFKIYFCFRKITEIVFGSGEFDRRYEGGPSNLSHASLLLQQSSEIAYLPLCLSFVYHLFVLKYSLNVKKWNSFYDLTFICAINFL